MRFHKIDLSPMLLIAAWQEHHGWWAWPESPGVAAGDVLVFERYGEVVDVSIVKEVRKPGAGPVDWSGPNTDGWHFAELDSIADLVKSAMALEDSRAKLG
jgi:hypothetical protein